MRRPANNLRRHIVDWLINWSPQAKWTGDMMQDAAILVGECQRILPYITVMYHRLQNKVSLRDQDYTFEDGLRYALPYLSINMRKWLFSSPYLQAPVPTIYNSVEGRYELTTKIRYGYLDGHRSPNVTSHLELSALQSQFRYWFDPKGIREARVGDLFTFVKIWGHPENILSLRGRAAADRYAFVTNPTVEYE